MSGCFWWTTGTDTQRIRTLLANREDIVVVGESSTFDETIQKTAELHSG